MSDTNTTSSYPPQPDPWKTPAFLVSVAVLVLYAAVMLLLLFRGIPNGVDGTTLTLMLGTLTAMATLATQYWLGSSAGSANKDHLLRNSVPLSLLPQPAAIVPSTDAPPRAVTPLRDAG